MRVVCDEILFVQKMNPEKHAGNKCVGFEMKDEGLLVVVLTMSLILKVLSNSIKVTVLFWKVGILNEGVEEGGDDGWWWLIWGY